MSLSFRRWALLSLFASLVVLTAPARLFASSLVFSAAGADPTSIQATVDAFRAAAGSPNNGNLVGSQSAGRREINWDGGGAGAAATVFTSPMTNFNLAVPRGAVFTTAGTGFEISGQPLPEFGDINATYPDIFQTFSAPRLFAPLGSNVLDVNFFVPGTTIPTVVFGFGAVFTDVDLASTTSLQFFDKAGVSLGTFFAQTANNGLSFLGVMFTDAVGRVRITTGNSALGPLDGGGIDVVAMDDFIFSEPVAIPEPASLLLIGGGIAALVTRARRRRQR